MKKHILLLALLALSANGLKSVDLVQGEVNAKNINLKKGEIPLRIENRSDTNIVWVILNRKGLLTRAYCIGDVKSKWDLGSRGSIKPKFRKDVGRIKINGVKEVNIKRNHNIKQIGVRYEGLGVKSTNYRKNYKVFLGIGKKVLVSSQHIYKIGIEIYNNYIVVKKYVIDDKDVKKTKNVR